MTTFPPAITVASTITPNLTRTASTSSNALTVNQATQLQTRIFDALGGGEAVVWDQLVSPDFRAFERGNEFTRESFFQIVLDAKKSGKRIRWSVTDPRVQADLNLLVLSYVNVGSISINGGAPKPTRWLETASYRLTPGGWQLFLMTSERTADSQAVQ